MTKGQGPATEPGYNFDFNADLPSSAHQAADAVTEEDTLRLFQELHAANILWSEPGHGPRAAARQALRAVRKFLHANAQNVGGAFSRPLDLLSVELLNAPAPDPGNILPPWEHRQTPERNQRQAINYGKAAAAYAADRLKTEGVNLEAACQEVADTLVVHGFPLTEKQRGDGKLAAAVKKWRARFPTEISTAADFYRQFETAPPIPFALLVDQSAQQRQEQIRRWFKTELNSMGKVAAK